MFEWNGFAYSFDYVNDNDNDYDYDYDFDYTYGNRKGPHKQSLIVKCFYYFQNSNIFYFLKVRIVFIRSNPLTQFCNYFADKINEFSLRRTFMSEIVQMSTL